MMMPLFMGKGYSWMKVSCFCCSQSCKEGSRFQTDVSPHLKTEWSDNVVAPGRDLPTPCLLSARSLPAACPQLHFVDGRAAFSWVTVAAECLAFLGREGFSCCLKLKAVGTAVAVGLAGSPSFPCLSEVA